MPTNMSTAHELAERYNAGMAERQKDRTRAQLKFSKVHTMKPETLGCTCGWPNGEGSGVDSFDTDLEWFLAWTMMHHSMSWRQDLVRQRYVKKLRWIVAVNVACFWVALGGAAAALYSSWNGWMKLILFSVNVILALWLVARTIVELDTLRMVSPETYWGEVARRVREGGRKTGV